MQHLASHPAFQETIHNGSQLVQEYQGDVYFYDGKLKTFRLKDWRRSIQNGTQASFKHLQVSDLDQVNSIHLNPQGKMMALVGSKLVIAILPLFVKSKSKSTVCETLVVGNQYYVHDYNRIVKAMWHPSSRTGSHLLVLSANGILRLFDVAADVEEPEQVFYFCSPDYKKQRSWFGGNPDEMEAVSFCLGSGSTWDSMTVYGLLKSGDLVSICPVLPNESQLDPSRLDELSLETSYRWEQLKDQHLQSDHFWTSKFLGQLSKGAAHGYIRPLQHLQLAKTEYNYVPRQACEWLDQVHDVCHVPHSAYSIVLILTDSSVLVGLSEPVGARWAFEHVLETHLDPALPP